MGYSPIVFDSAGFKVVEVDQPFMLTLHQRLQTSRQRSFANQAQVARLYLRRKIRVRCKFAYVAAWHQLAIENPISSLARRGTI